MFVLLISRGTPSKYAPQWGCFEKDQAEALTALGHKVVVISVDSRFRWIPRRFGLTHTVINEINYYSSFYIPSVLFEKIGAFKFNLFLRLLQFGRIYKHIFKVYGKPDIVYSHYLSNTYLATKLKDRYNIPIVAIEHWSKLNANKLPFDARFMGDYAYKRVTALISVSESLRQQLLRHFEVNSVVVHNMVGLEFCQELLPMSQTDRTLFVSTGNLIHRKGFDLLIRAFCKLNLPTDKWRLSIIGDGEERERLQEQIDIANFQNNIYLLGCKNKDEIISILRDSHVFILPSRNENFSVAVLEALCEGLPVIASICGGIRECINESNGLLFPVDDVDALSEALLFMCTNYKTYNRRSIAEDSRKRFSPQTIAKQLVDIFESVKDK